MGTKAVTKARRAAHFRGYGDGQKVSRQRQWQLDRLAEGQCERCGREPLCSVTLCRGCLRETRKSRRVRGGHRPWTPGGLGRPPVDAKRR